MNYPNGKPTPERTPATGDPFFELASECPVEAWLHVLGHRWNALVLYHLSRGGLRFSDLQAALPTVSAKVLSERLSELVRRDLARVDGHPRSRRYALTPRGDALMPILHAIERWSRPHPADRPLAMPLLHASSRDASRRPLASLIDVDFRRGDPCS